MCPLQTRAIAAHSAAIFCIVYGIVAVFAQGNGDAAHQPFEDYSAQSSRNSERSPVIPPQQFATDVAFRIEGFPPEARANKLPFCNRALSLEARANDLVSRLTLTEKIGLLSNRAQAVPRLGLRAYEWWSEALHGVAFSPGTHFAGPIKCVTSFPQLIRLGVSFNKSLWNAVGQVSGTGPDSLEFY